MGSNSSINKYIMNFLSIDCSTNVGSLFLKVKNKVFNKVLQSNKSNNDLLMKNILDFLVENDQEFDNIEEIFVNQGPGNFSGLRGSLSIAKGISLSKNLNLYGYNTFIWSCARFLNKKDFIFSIIEFRKKYYYRKFDKNLKEASDIKEIKKQEIIKNFYNKFKIIPKQMVKNFDKKILNLHNTNIINLDHNDLELLKLNGLLNEGAIKPLYLS
jgi:tRNA threonylcarbamoyl adenosine modification protein YeaZ